MMIKYYTENTVSYSKTLCTPKEGKDALKLHSTLDLYKLEINKNSILKYMAVKTRNNTFKEWYFLGTFPLDFYTYFLDSINNERVEIND